MKRLALITLIISMVACVPIKKYRELESNYNKCLEEQSEYKSKALDYENQVKELNVQLEKMRSEIETLKSDTTLIGEQYRAMQLEYQRTKETNEALEKKYEKLVSDGNAETAKLINDLESTRIELQKK